MTDSKNIQDNLNPCTHDAKYKVDVTVFGDTRHYDYCTFCNKRMYNDIDEPEAILHD